MAIGGDLMTQPKARTTPRAAAASEPSASQQIDARIQSLDDWRGETLARIRSLIHEVGSGRGGNLEVARRARVGA